ncbi:superoxide dismutase family protein [Asticcacaulis aquaticus]|uniref:superoxide dismutase family protein n=1 Tax=Asticcacaulis aquaticus TaxID=2984212 RepID=UPI003F6225F9
MRAALLSGLMATALASAAGAAAPGTLTGNDGKALGTVTVTPAPKGVILKIDASGLPEGWHGVHFHAKGDCGDTAKFQNSGGHVHHGDAALTHGLLNPASNDSGDLTNIYVHKDGTAKAEIYSSFVLVEAKDGSALPALKDADGSAVVIHASADDYTSQPIGGAGARIACAVLP